MIKNISSYNFSSTDPISNHISKSLFFQPKLAVNQPGDVYEQEANNVAAAVIRMPETAIGENFFSRPVIQRNCAHCEEKKELQRKESNDHAKAGLQTENYISNLSGGKPLHENEKNFFEPGIGYNFSDVSIHDDAAAYRSAKKLNALAYTHGNHIVFGENQYQPHTSKGKKLLAHELTHVVQQSKGMMPGNAVQRKVAYEGEEVEEDIDPLTPGKKAAGTTNIIVNETSLKGLDWKTYLNLLFPLPEVEKVTKKFLLIKKDHCMVKNRDIHVIVKSILHVLKPGPWSATIPVSRLREYSGKPPPCRETGDTATLIIVAEDGEEKIREHVFAAEMQHAADNACLTKRYLESYETDVLALPEELTAEEAEACNSWLEDHLKRKERAIAFNKEHTLFGDGYDTAGGPHFLDFTFQYDLMDCSNIIVKVTIKPLPRLKRDCSAWPVP